MKPRMFPLAKTLLMLLALLAALFLKGAVMQIPNADGAMTRETFSYLSKTPFVYGNFAPMFTAITVIIGTFLALLSIILWRSRDMATAVCFAGVIGFVLSLGPILLGKGYYNVGSFLVSLLLFMQLPVYILERAAQRAQAGN